ncbi:MFS transporter [Candidatus Methylacidithermus pantelleriae]|uniref:Major facilitator superfamily (MFS) profile domain-containing protein n=1 Tax=Candidatus Methylacidithermus pantelleriae TaxID=2744239 RepID=A0A8J2FTN9_9BACT|nr:MFS transporter [Candidatus Methylacidithermus pantelleriae]CAF0702680.1 conserved membrane hypothetical protein [Candidatus Methylacidithermus pantelleriae]
MAKGREIPGSPQRETDRSTRNHKVEFAFAFALGEFLSILVRGERKTFAMRRNSLSPLFQKVFSRCQNRPLTFVLLLGLVSLLADLTYEGARSILGPYLGTLGASGKVVAIIAGAGELVGFAFRFLSGTLTDQTRRYWTITLAGYAVNLLAVPALALTQRWEWACALVVLERMGKGLRTPARDAMLSQVVTPLGRGWGFGLHEALDQVGAMGGPLLVAAVLAFEGNYRVAFATLAIPAVFALLVLNGARILYPRPHEVEREEPANPTGPLRRTFWWYLVAASLMAAGFVDFPLVAFHLERSQKLPPPLLPLLYSLAMGADAVGALLLGRLYDRLGLRVVLASTLLSLPATPMIFLGDFWVAFVGILFWGIGLGAQESILRAAIASMTPSHRRGSSYGLFSMTYGFAWFLGSSILGVLYEQKLSFMVGVSAGFLFFSCLILFLLCRNTPQLSTKGTQLVFL